MQRGRWSVEQHTKHFSDELNKALDDLGAPIGIRERATILSKMLHIPKQEAWGLLDGHLTPDNQFLQRMSSEIEIDIKPFLKNEK